MCSANSQPSKPDRHDAVGLFVELEEAAEGFEFGWLALHVGPAAIAEGAVDAVAAGPGVGGDAAELGPGDAVVASFGDAGGVDGKEGVGAAGGDGGDARGEASS